MKNLILISFLITGSLLLNFQGIDAAEKKENKISRFPLPVPSNSTGYKTAPRENRGSETNPYHELGIPIIQNYMIKDFIQDYPDESGQVFSITQDHRGVMYFGLNNHIAQFNGKNWLMIPVPSGSVRDMQTGRDGTIYVSMNSDMGCLAGDDRGTLSYISLLNKLNIDKKELSRIYSIHLTPDYVNFISSNIMYRYHDKTFEVTRDNALRVGYNVHNVAYTINKRIGVILDGVIHHIPYFDKIDFGKTIVLPWSDDRALIISSQKGMFIHDLKRFTDAIKSKNADQPIDSYLTPFTSEIDPYILEHGAYCGTPLDDKRFAIGTSGGGVIIMDDQGRFVQLLNVESGLVNDLIFSLFVDQTGNLWVGTNKGISYIAVSSPLTIFDNHKNFNDPLSTAMRYDGVLYLGTINGVCFLPPYRVNQPIGNYKLTRIQNLKDQCFGMLIYKGAFIAVSGNAVIQVTEHITKSVIQIDQSIISMTQTKRFPDYIFMGVDRGIQVVKLKSNQDIPGKSVQSQPILTGEIVSNKALKNIDANNIYSIIVDEKGDLWAPSNRKGIYHIRWHGKELDDLKIFNYGLEDGLPSLKENTVASVNGKVFIGTKKGLYQAVEEPTTKKIRIVPENTFGILFNRNGISITGILTDLDKNPWIITPKGAGIIKQDPAGNFVWDTKITGLLSGNLVYLYPETGQISWLSTQEALYRYDAGIQKNYNREFFTSIHKVAAGSEQSRRILIMGGYFDLKSNKPGKPGRATFKQPPYELCRLEYRDNSISFEYSATFYEMPEKTKYRYILEGFNKNWSNWSPATTKEYTNLPEGDYIFRVRALNIYNKISREASYSFSVLPPWTHTWWGLSLRFIGFGLLLTGGILLYTRKLRKQKETLERLVAERTQQLKDASLTDPLTGLRNRRFISEILQNDIDAFVSFKNYLQLSKENKRKMHSENIVFGIFMIDIDHFKQVNDTYGHDAGDQLLRQLARILKDMVRQDDAVIRVGGEEFLVILKKSEPEYLERFSLNVLEKIAATDFEIGNGIVLKKTCSIGYTAFPVFSGQPDLLSFEQSIMVADMALYYAKQHGRNQSVFLTEGDRRPNERQEIQKVVTTLNFSLNEGFLRIPTKTPANSIKLK